MSSPREVHRSAIESAHSAHSFLERAYQQERQAAAMLHGRLDCQPTRSVLYRSAAVLGMRLGKPKEAGELARTGLEQSEEHPVQEPVRGELLDLLLRAGQTTDPLALYLSEDEAEELLDCLQGLAAPSGFFLGTVQTRLVGLLRTRYGRGGSAELAELVRAAR